jgi:phage FluMu protein Com
MSVLFYCRDCKKLVAEPVRNGTKYEYSCPECKSDRVAFGSQKAICDFFQVTPPKTNA